MYEKKPMGKILGRNFKFPRKVSGKMQQTLIEKKNPKKSRNLYKIIRSKNLKNVRKILGKIQCKNSNKYNKNLKKKIQNK